MIEISPADRVFVLTGAGVSAESGLPTFRGEGGLWRNVRVEEVASPDAWKCDPQFVWEFYSMRRRAAAAAKPNPGHLALAALEADLRDHLFLCTQNVDNLHEQAGTRHAVHMHGELFKSRCEACTLPPFDDANTYEPPASLPRCECGGRIRPHICWFGEVPYHVDRIYRALNECTLFVAIGTSGMVEPAASFATQARSRGRTFYVGPEEPARSCRNSFASNRCAYCVRSSFSTLPSRTRITRCACVAMSGSCVTRMIVLPP
jgi:NAD-dependent deacetylase